MKHPIRKQSQANKSTNNSKNQKPQVSKTHNSNTSKSNNTNNNRNSGANVNRNNNSNISNWKLPSNINTQQLDQIASTTQFCFWKVDDNSTEIPLDELKAIRKAMAINVKGQAEQCPPPIEDINNQKLPKEFRLIFDACGLQIPTSIQLQGWPAILKGLNVLGISPTGSGKTLTYALPMIPHIQHRLQHDGKCKFFDIPAPMALIITPTRELTIQVNNALKPFKRICNISSVAIYGGDDKEKQIDELIFSSTNTSSNQSKAIVVATPGRLLDLVSSRKLSLINVTYFVIDEADRMLALGFREQISLIISQIHPKRQSLMFSATFPGKLRELVDEWAPNATILRCNTLELSNSMTLISEDVTNEDLEINSSNNTKAMDITKSSYSIPSSIHQSIHVCSSHKKPRLLIRYITKMRDEEKLVQVRQSGLMLIFCTKIKTLKFIADFLKRQNYNSFTILHGQLPQSIREQALLDFRSGKVPTLLATDVAARGIHIKRLKYVVNYDFPSNIEQYCHRVGRTGRQGDEGFAYSLLSYNMAVLAKDLITLLEASNQTIEPNLLKLASEYSSGSLTTAHVEEEEDGEEEE